MSELKNAPDVPLSKVEWRVDGRPYKSRVRVVPYIDARDVAEMLDEWVGPANWKDKYSDHPIAGKPAEMCMLSVRVGDEWVTKQDVGVPSNFESQKGTVSDAFKRVATIKWGVGRNVYELPADIWVPCDVKDDKAYLNDKSLPAIHEELRKRGFGDVQGGRVANDPEPVAEPERYWWEPYIEQFGPHLLTATNEARTHINFPTVPDLVNAPRPSKASLAKILKRARELKEAGSSNGTEGGGVNPSATPPASSAPSPTSEDGSGSW
jgi:hypothetical protein